MPIDILLSTLTRYFDINLQGYDNTESSVRKASVFCLVAIYMSLGEELRPHLSELNGSKVGTCHRYLSLCVSVVTVRLEKNLEINMSNIFHF